MNKRHLVTHSLKKRLFIKTSLLSLFLIAPLIIGCTTNKSKSNNSNKLSKQIEIKENKQQEKPKTKELSPIIDIPKNDYYKVLYANNIKSFVYDGKVWDDQKQTYDLEFVNKLLAYIDQHISNLVDFELVKNNQNKPWFKWLIDYYMFLNVTYFIDNKPKFLANSIKYISLRDPEHYFDEATRIFKKYYHPNKLSSNNKDYFYSWYNFIYFAHINHYYNARELYKYYNQKFNLDLPSKYINHSYPISRIYKNDRYYFSNVNRILFKIKTYDKTRINTLFLAFKKLNQSNDENKNLIIKYLKQENLIDQNYEITNKLDFNIFLEKSFLNNKEYSSTKNELKRFFENINDQLNKFNLFVNAYWYDNKYYSISTSNTKLMNDKIRFSIINMLWRGYDITNYIKAKKDELIETNPINSHYEDRYLNLLKQLYENEWQISINKDKNIEKINQLKTKNESLKTRMQNIKNEFLQYLVKMGIIDDAKELADFSVSEFYLWSTYLSTK